MLIALEGVDCSGKSSVGRYIADSQSAEYYPTPSGNYLKERERIDALATPEEHYAFYQNATRSASDDLVEFQEKGRVVLIDRYWMTTVAYHRAMGVNVLVSDFRHITPVDWTFYFDVTPREQEYRFALRGMSAGDKRTLDIQHKIRSEYEKLFATESRITKIVTDELTIHDISRIVLQRMSELQFGVVSI